MPRASPSSRRGLEDLRHVQASILSTRYSGRSPIAKRQRCRADQTGLQRGRVARMHGGQARLLLSSQWSIARLLSSASPWTSAVPSWSGRSDGCRVRPTPRAGGPDVTGCTSRRYAEAPRHSERCVLCSTSFGLGALVSIRRRTSEQAEFGGRKKPRYPRNTRGRLVCPDFGGWVVGDGDGRGWMR